MSDWTRKHDLEMLGQELVRAKSRAEREWLEKKIWKIMGESKPIQALREELVGAVRIGDTRTIERLQNKIHAIRQRETNFKSWGNVKGEEIDKYDG